MINLSIGTMIHRPVKQVFDFVSTPENDFQWQYETLATTSISEGKQQIGAFFRSIGHLMGHRVLGTFEVTEYEPNKKYGFKSLSGPLQSYTSYTFDTESGCTRINVCMQANIVNFFQIDEDVLGKKIKKQLRENLAMLRDLLEATRMLTASETSSLVARNLD